MHRYPVDQAGLRVYNALNRIYQGHQTRSPRVVG